MSLRGEANPQDRSQTSRGEEGGVGSRKKPLGASESDGQQRIMCRWLSEPQGMMGEALKGSRKAGILERSATETRT